FAGRHEPDQQAMQPDADDDNQDQRKPDRLPEHAPERPREHLRQRLERRLEHGLASRAHHPRKWLIREARWCRKTEEGTRRERLRRRPVWGNVLWTPQRRLSLPHATLRGMKRVSPRAFLAASAAVPAAPALAQTGSRQPRPEGNPDAIIVGAGAAGIAA